ncbi:MAG TPA: tRNA uracil 4-sulfurtransferase ThiI [Planctomycetota bacterium]
MQTGSVHRNALVVRYDEIGLKGGNRGTFERHLQDNLQAALAHHPGVKVSRIRGRALIRADVPVEQLAEAASRVFGVSSLSPARECARNLEAIAALVHEEAARALAGRFAGRDEVRFRVAVKRADKTFPMSSPELERELGGRLHDAFAVLRCDLEAPELTVEVDIRTEGVWVFAVRLPGPGGLPVSTLGRALCLLSGGIDSPVAAWRAMKRGLRIEFVHFYSFPFTGPQTREKILRIAEHLARWQPVTVLHVVPFAAIQVAIRDGSDRRYRTVLYRRAMNRIATILASRRRCGALVTGENLGQVASQTLQNLRLIEGAAGLPVLRPLISADKYETIGEARRIGTYEISMLPAQDCCTLFQPGDPVIHGRPGACAAAEAGLELDQLIHEAVLGTERLQLSQRP